MHRIHRVVLLSCLALPLVVSCSGDKAAPESADPAPTTSDSAKKAGTATSATVTPTGSPALEAAPEADGYADRGAAGGPAGRDSAKPFADPAVGGGKGDSAALDIAAPRRLAGKLDSKRRPPRKPAEAIIREEIPPVPEQQTTAGRLTAGEWRDLDNWSFFRALFTGGQRNPKGDWANMETHWGFDTAGRISVTIEDAGRPVIDAEVTLRDGDQRMLWRARTDNRGQAHLFAGLFARAEGPFVVEARSGDRTVRRSDISARGSEPLRLELAGADAPPNALDVMFVVDTTGSMGDELSYLKAELGWVLRQAAKEHGEQLAVRTSVNFFRDEGDEYKVRPFAFTTNIDQVLGQIRGQHAAGGGDFPEAVEAALDNAIRNHDWSPRARARLLFLVLDAPPHHTPQILNQLHALSEAAARKGIRIIPLAGSGIDKPTEFLMRFLAVSTGGTYTFLTDHSGIGGSHIKPTIGPHEIYRLNDLLVRVIRSYLS